MTGSNYNAESTPFVEFPLPTDKVALIDLDGTLIDASYRITDDTIGQTIHEAQEAGWTLGLSSDSPYEALETWRKRLGLNGPVLAENGGLVAINDRQSYDTEEAATFEASRNAFTLALQDAGMDVWCGNPVEALRNGRPLGSAGRPLVLINVLRKVSLGFFVRQVQADTALAIDTDTTEAVIEMGRTHYPPFDDLLEDINHEYGILIARRRHVDKRLGSLVLTDDYGISQFAMIGNSASDYVGSDIALHYAVANSSQDLKSRADYTSPHPITSGVKDILSRFYKPDNLPQAE